MKTTVTHPLYGKISYDTGTGEVRAQKGDLAERLTWLVHHQDQLGGGYYPNAFLRACELLGVIGGELDSEIKTEGEIDPGPNAEY